MTKLTAGAQAGTNERYVNICFTPVRYTVF